MLPAANATLKQRLSLIITGLIAAVTIAGVIYIVFRASDDTGAEVASALSLADHLVAADVALMQDEWLTHGFSPPRFHLQALTDVRHVSVTFIDEKGRMVESNRDKGIPEPAAPEWFNWLVRFTSVPTPPLVHDVSFEGRELGRLVISANPTSEVEEIWVTSKNLMGLLVLLFVLLNALVWLAVSHTMRPIERIIGALSEMERGNLATRLPSFGALEMSRISVGFNRMAQALEQSMAENRRLTVRMLHVQEEERKSLARDLHDEIGQCMSAIHAEAIVIRNSGGPQVRESAEAIVAVTDRIKNMIRSMLKRLRPPALEGLGLEAALRELAAAFEQRNPHISCLREICPQVTGLSGEPAITLYRIAQECLTNVALHARAHRVSIETTLLADSVNGTPRIRLIVTDDGVGFFVVSSGRGYGLTGIRERVEALGGCSDIDSNLGRGTRVCVELPLELPESRRVV